MRNLKRGTGLVAAIFMVLTMVFLSGCGEKIEIDAQSLADSLLNEVSYQSKLQQIKEDSLGDFITIEEGISGIMYMGSGACADSFGVFTCVDEEQAASLNETVKLYMDDLINSFEDYIPEEAAKVKNSILIQKGPYVVFCITSDRDNAGNVINAAFGEPITEESSEDGDNNDENDDAAEEPDNENESGTNDAVESQNKYEVIESDAELKDFGSVVLIGDAGYELYSYSEGVAKKYATAVNTVADKLSGTSNVYEIVIPLSSGITLPDKFFSQISSSNQEKALGNILDMADENVKTINLYDNLMKHRKEYIYFRTDHHWTALGAYYGYEMFCAAKGIEPVSLEERERVDFQGFLGSFYKDAKEPEIMKNKPDVITAYYPASSDVSLKYTTTAGKTGDWKVIYDVSDYPSSVKYSTFIAGDNPFTVISNNEISDGSSCVVIKESFGNAFVPFLVDHYQTIYVIDYRYWNGNIVSFAEENSIDDVIFANNLSMTRSDYLTGKLNQVC